MSNNDIKDDFWDIDLIMPKRKNPTSPNNTNTEPADISFGKDINDTKAEKIPEASETERHRTARLIIEQAEKRSVESRSYKPDNPNFVSVTVNKWPSYYTFYDKFIIHGKKYLHSNASVCDYVPFISYMPQYNQLSLAQLKYYIWWRRNVRNGKYIQSDSGYIFLYIHELINIEEGFTAEYRLDQMCNIWVAYRDSFPRLDDCLAEWVCDFCLINRLPLPQCIDEISEVISYKASLREFYTDPYGVEKKENLKRLIALNSKYNYKNSASYAKHSAEYDKHILAAAVYALEHVPEIGETEGKPRLLHIVRDSYSGALCVYSVKRKLEIEYYSHFKSIEFKNISTMLVKRSDALLSSALGVKKRCTVSELPERLASALKEYYDIHFPKKAQSPDPKKEAEKIRYELYEAVNSELNIESAFAIEDRSWDTTLKLIPEEELKEMIQKPIEPPAFIQPADDDCYARLLCSLNSFQYEFLRLLHEGRKQQANELCKKNNLLPASVENEINELASDITGDIITEDFEVIGDYADELKFQ